MGHVDIHVKLDDPSLQYTLKSSNMLVTALLKSIDLLKTNILIWFTFVGHQVWT